MKVVLWGHLLHTHTSSYVHYGFAKAFRKLGHEVSWFDNDSNVSGFDFSNVLFITEGQVDQNIPIRKDCTYILHNCRSKKYDDLPRVLRLYILLEPSAGGVWKEKGEKIGICHYYKKDDKLGSLFQPWGTDLLPEEIDTSKTMYDWPRDRKIFYVGTRAGYDDNGTIPVIDAFAEEAKKHGIEMVCQGGYSGGGMIGCEEAYALVRRSYMAPALQCKWQVDHGHAPCRIFKNISYGHMGITNSPYVYELFQKIPIYDSNPVTLFNKAMEAIEKGCQDRIKCLMEEVKKQHTYIDRAKHILEVI